MILDFFKKIPKKISAYSIGKKIYVITWIITAIFLIVTIVLFVVWQNSSLATQTNANTLLTKQALYQQVTISAITFTTVVILAIAIFATTIESVLAKKRLVKGKNKNVG